MPPEVRALARKRTVRAVRKLTALLDDKSGIVCVAAARELLDRGWGKPVQAIEQKGEQQLIFVVGRTLPKSYDPLGPALPAHVTDSEIIPSTEEILDIAVDPPPSPQNGSHHPRNGYQR